MMDLMKKDLHNRYLLIIDLFSITVSFLLTSWVRYGSISNNWFYVNTYGIAYAIVISLYIAIFLIYETSGKSFKRGYIEEMIAIAKINAFLAVTLTVVMYIFQQGTSFSRFFFFLFFIFNILITLVFRQYFKILLFAVYKKSKSSNKIMIITTADQIHKVLGRFKREFEWEYQITYLTILDKTLIGQKIDGIEVKADFFNMYEVAKNEVLDGVFIHIPNDYQLNLNLEEVVLGFQNMGITVDLSINTFGLRIHEKVVREMSGYHVLTFSNRIFTEGQLLVKRIFDIAGGLVGCLITVFAAIIIAPAIRLESKGPIFFSQVRIGRNGRRFRIYKFRSMYMDAEERLAELMKNNEMSGHMFKMKDDPRITKVGKFLRKTSLDELPQFFNILKGDMSLVGTRPPTEMEFLQYEGRHKRRLALKSGLTGLWQVSGRSDITEFEDVVKMDLEYIDNWSMKLDIKIIMKTIGVVLFCRGAK